RCDGKRSTRSAVRDSRLAGSANREPRPTSRESQLLDFVAENGRRVLSFAIARQLDSRRVDVIGEAQIRLAHVFLVGGEIFFVQITGEREESLEIDARQTNWIADIVRERVPLAGQNLPAIRTGNLGFDAHHDLAGNQLL